MVERIIQQKYSHFLEDQCLEISMASAIFLSAILVLHYSGTFIEEFMLG